jgi:hypothetical protein
MKFWRSLRTAINLEVRKKQERKEKAKEKRKELQ